MAIRIKYVSLFSTDGELISITVMVPQVSVHVRAELFQPEFDETGDLTPAAKDRLLKAARDAYAKKSAALDQVEEQLETQAEKQRKINLAWTEQDIIGGIPPEGGQHG